MAPEIFPSQARQAARSENAMIPAILNPRAVRNSFSVGLSGNFPIMR